MNHLVVVSRNYPLSRHRRNDRFLLDAELPDAVACLPTNLLIITLEKRILAEKHKRTYSLSFHYNENVSDAEQ